MPHTPSHRTDQELSPVEAARQVQEVQEGQADTRATRAAQIIEAADTTAARDAVPAAQQIQAIENPEDDPGTAKVGGIFKSVQDLAQLAFPSAPITQETMEGPEAAAEQRQRAMDQQLFEPNEQVEEVIRAADPIGAATRTGRDIAAEDREIGDTPGGIGRTGELGLRAAKGAILLPAGAERVLTETVETTGLEIPDTIELGNLKLPTDPLQDLRDRTEAAQQYIQEGFNNDPNEFLNVAGEVAGAFATGEVALAAAGIESFSMLSTKSAWRLLGKGPATMTMPESMAMARTVKDVPWSRALALAGEGSLTTAGMEDTTPAQWLFGGVAGAGLSLMADAGRAVSKRMAQRKARKVYEQMQKRIDQLEKGQGDFEIQNFPSFLARIDSNLQQTLVSREVGDDVVSAMKATLSESGETGSMGAVRGLTEMDESTLAELQNTFPNYRFHVVGRVQGDQLKDQKLLYGLDPDVELPQGTQGSAPKLTDKAIEEFKQSGLVRGQKVLVNGQEHQFQRMTDGGNLLVKKPGRRPQTVAPERVARLDEVGGVLKNERLLDQYRSFKAANRFGDDDQAFNAFWERFLEDDADPSLRPHLREYFDQEEAKLLSNNMRPDETRVLENFKRARRRLIREGGEETLEDLAAARGHAVSRIDRDRVKLTNMLDGRTRPFRSEDHAREYLQELEVKIPDVTPSIPGIPDELLEGMAVPAAPTNPAIGGGDAVMNKSIRENAPSTVKRLWFEFGAGTKRIKEALLDIEEQTGVPVWTEAGEQLMGDARRAFNRGKRFADKAERLMDDLDQDELALVEDWLRSEQKTIFEKQNDINDELIDRAEQIRLLYEDLFNEFTTFTGTNLSAEDWYRNYAPDMRKLMSEGRTDFIRAWEQGRGDEIPAEWKFFAEEMKTGALAQSPQATLEEKTIRLIRSGVFKAHAGDSWRQAYQFWEELDESANPLAKKKLQDYLAGFIGGSDDAVRNYMEGVMERTAKEMGVRNPGQVRNALDGMVDMTYGGLIAYQPELIFRQTFQMPGMLGPVLDDTKMVARVHWTDALTNDGLRQWAEDIGARTFRIPLTFGEGLDEAGGAGRLAKVKGMAKRAAQKGIKPYQLADDWNRITAAIATRKRVDPLIKRFNAGELNETELLNQSGIGFLSRPQQTRFLNLLDGAQEIDIPGQTAAERARNYAAREMSDFTNFLYGSRNSQKWMRSTLGRLGFSYSTWPSGYLNYVDRLAKAAKRGDVTKGRFVKTMAKHGGLNTGVKMTGAAMGLNLSNWMMWGALGFSLAPGWQLLEAGYKTVMGPSWERGEAFDALMDSGPRMLMPGGALVFDNVPTALQRLTESREFDAAAEFLGFSTPEEGQVVPGIPGPPLFPNQPYEVEQSAGF